MVLRRYWRLLARQTPTSNTSTVVGRTLLPISPFLPLRWTACSSHTVLLQSPSCCFPGRPQTSQVWKDSSMAAPMRRLMASSAWLKRKPSNLTWKRKPPNFSFTVQNHIKPRVAAKDEMRRGPLVFNANLDIRIIPVEFFRAQPSTLYGLEDCVRLPLLQSR
jgi:hypothetical protein